MTKKLKMKKDELIKPIFASSHVEKKVK